MTDLLNAAVDGKLDEVNKLLAATDFQAPALEHALIATIIKGHKDVMSALLLRKEIKVSMFNNAALKWAMSKKNNEAVDLLTSHSSFSFGVNTSILMTAVLENCPKVLELALQCPTLPITPEIAGNCLKKAAKMELIDIMIVLLGDGRVNITEREMKVYLDEDIPADVRNKIFATILNNPSLDISPRALITIGCESTPEILRMAYLYHPEFASEAELTGKAIKRDDFTLFKLCCDTDDKEQIVDAIEANKHEWVRYLIDNNKISKELLDCLEEPSDPEMAKILGMKKDE
jgi:hypothetical protein